MLKSNNFNSIVGDLSTISATNFLEALRPTIQLEPFHIEPLAPLEISPLKKAVPSISNIDCNTYFNTNNETERANSETDTATASTSKASLAALQLSEGVLQSYAPPIIKAKTQIKELIHKQNKIYIDLSAEKFKLDNADDMDKLKEMMNNVKLCREKLLKIKKNMQSIYQRTKELKKRAANIKMCKEKELQRKLQKQQHEESLIGKQPQ